MQKSERQAQKILRLKLTLTPEQRRLIERAATLRRLTAEEFVVASAVEAAIRTVNNFKVLYLRDEGREVFINAILNPAVPNDAARAAASRYKKQTRP